MIITRKAKYMGIMADRLAAMVVKATSPDGKIEGELRDNDALQLTFRPGSYRYYTEDDLGRQLSRLALRMWTGYQRAYDDAVAEATGRPVERSIEEWDANRRRFRKAQAETKCTGFSTGGWVYAETTGMVSWAFVVRNEALSNLSEEEFVSEVLSAYFVMNDDYRTKMRELRAQHYGRGFA